MDCEYSFLQAKGCECVENEDCDESKLISKDCSGCFDPKEICDNESSEIVWILG